MKKRILSLLLAFIVLCGLLPLSSVSVRAYSETDIAYPVEGGNIYFDKSSGAITDCDATVTSADIPSAIDGVAVTSIGDEAFYNCSSLTSVTIPKSVTSIGDDAFFWCSSLTSVTIPKSVTSIGYNAFSCCISLTSVTIPNSVTSIGNYVFNNCSSLTSVTIPDSVTSIGECAFSWCSNLTSVTIPESVTSIGDSAFSSCSSLTSVTIPDSVTSIEYGTFEYCSSLTSVTIPDSVTSIEYGAFEYCCSLTSVTIPNSVTSIGDSAFSECSSLTSVTIPNSVTGIGAWAFSECSSLTSVCFMGNAPVELGRDAFKMYDSGTYVNIPGLTLYYIEGKEGWTSPTWNGYPTATWEPEEPTPPVEFVDVPQNEWYVGAVDYAVRNGLMGGVSATEFAPEDPMTRAMLVTVLWRYEGKPMGYQNTFSDVNAKNGSWYIDAVAWAAANGIVGGIGNNKFDPDGNITREQMATILYRYATKKGIDTGKRGDLSAFPDGGKVESWAKDAVQWTVAEKIIGGSEGYLLPQGNATRAQVATILMRFIENIVKE